METPRLRSLDRPLKNLKSSEGGYAIPFDRYEFGLYRLEPAARTLVRGETVIPLTSKAFDALVLLVQNHGQVLEREWLMEKLWPDNFVESNNLEQCVSTLRRTFGETAQTASYIRTVAGRGYCFAGVVKVVSLEPVNDVDRPVPVPPDAAFGGSGRGWFPVWAAMLGAIALVAVLTIALVRYEVPRQPNSPRLMSVTAFPGPESFPSISPDGNFVTFAWSPVDRSLPDIWIKAVDGDSLRRLTTTPAAEGVPAWSPDGREIAFPRAGQGVFVMSVLGTSERKVAESGSMVGWTPDGRALLVRDAGRRERSFGIFRIDLATGERNQITDAPSGIGDWTFDISPNGDSLAFVRYERPGVADVYVMRLNDGKPLRRTDWSRSISRVVWTPDGRELVYSVNDIPALGQSLFRVQAFGDRAERGVRALHAEAAGPSISRPGPGRAARLAFLTRRNDVGLRLIDLQPAAVDGAIQSIAAFCDSSRIDYPGPFSKSADQVAFVSTRSGSPQVWVANRDETGLRQVTTLEAVEMGIGSWSPDEQKLVIDAAIDGNSDMYAIRVDNGRVVRLTTEPSLDSHGSWSRDGRWIYFSSNRTGRPEVWKVPSEGGRALQITFQGGLDPKESADGQSLYYVDRPPPGAGGMSGLASLKRVPVNGGDETTILEGVRFGLWSVTSEGIVFLKVTPQHDELGLYDFRDRRERSLGRLPIPVSRVSGYGQLRVSQDGRWVLLSATDHSESDIMVADGFR